MYSILIHTNVRTYIAHVLTYVPTYVYTYVCTYVRTCTALCVCFVSSKWIIINSSLLHLPNFPPLHQFTHNIFMLLVVLFGTACRCFPFHLTLDSWESLLVFFVTGGPFELLFVKLFWLAWSPYRFLHTWLNLLSSRTYVYCFV